MEPCRWSLQEPRPLQVGPKLQSLRLPRLIRDDTPATAETESTASSSSSSQSSSSSDSWELADDARLLAPPLADDDGPPRPDRNAPWGTRGTQSPLHGERRKSVSSSKTSSVYSLRRKKKGCAVARTRALARAARLSYA